MTATFDSAKASAFAERLLTTLNDGALCLMISVGHRTGLLDAMRDLEPSTSAEIATKAGLNERYVREWLGAMVTGRIVDVNASTKFRCWEAWKTILLNVSKKAAAFLIRSFHAFTP